LGGGGTVGAVSATATGGTVAPGHSAGKLTTSGNAVLNGATHLALELNGTTTPGVSYDQLALVGTINAGSAILDVTVLGGYTPTTGDIFTIVDNDGTDAATGTFKDPLGNALPEAGTFSASGRTFRISYV